MRKLLALLFSVSSLSVLAQNQIHLGQYMIHQPFMNPASINSYLKPTFAAFYRTQWVQFEGAPVTQGFNAILPVRRLKHTVSLTAFHDAIGINNNSEISLSYAYGMKVGLNAYLSFGVAASLDLLQADYASLHTIDANDPLFMAKTPLTPLPDFKFGAYIFKNRTYAGFTIPNLLNNQVMFTSDGTPSGTTEFDVNDLHYYLHVGHGFVLNEKWDLNASTLVKQVSGAPMQFDLNAQVMYNKTVGFGLSYRTSKEALAMLTVQVIPALKFSYGYEYNFNQIGNYSNGSHEVMLIYQLTPPKDVVVAVPRF